MAAPGGWNADHPPCFGLDGPVLDGGAVSIAWKMIERGGGPLAVRPSLEAGLQRAKLLGPVPAKVASGIGPPLAVNKGFEPRGRPSLELELLAGGRDAEIVSRFDLHSAKGSGNKPRQGQLPAMVSSGRARPHGKRPTSKVTMAKPGPRGGNNRGPARLVFSKGPPRTKSHKGEDMKKAFLAVPPAGNSRAAALFPRGPWSAGRRATPQIRRPTEGRRHTRELYNIPTQRQSPGDSSRHPGTACGDVIATDPVTTGGPNTGARRN